MKRFLTSLLICMFMLEFSGITIASPVVVNGIQKGAPITYKKGARTIQYAFVFDGPSPKNEEVLKKFKKAIIETIAPDYRAGFSSNNIFVGNWTRSGVKSVSDKSLKSNATMVVSLGYLSSKYFNSLHDKNKFVVTIDQYGLRDLGGSFFNPVQQSIKGVQLFQRLIPFKKAAILMNSSFYKTQKNWNSILDEKLSGINYKIIPVNNDNISSVLNSINDFGADVVVVTPLFNLTEGKKHELISGINTRKI